MKKSLSKLKKEADKYYSRMRRMSEADHAGLVRCCTCGKTDNWKHMQLGHYISRNHLSTRYLDENTDIQCVGCNMFGGGKPDEFALFLMNKYGNGILHWLKEKKKEKTKYSRSDYEDMIAEYKRRIKEIE